MILFLFAIVFIAQLIIAAALIIKLVDIDIAILIMDEELQARESVVKCSMYYLKEVTESYKELTRVTFENLDKKLRKSNAEKLKSAVISLIVAFLPKRLRRFINSSKWGFRIAKYLYNL